MWGGCGANAQQRNNLTTTSSHGGLGEDYDDSADIDYDGLLPTVLRNADI